MPKLYAVQVGDPVIRAKCREVLLTELDSKEVQDCITKMREVNLSMKGVGISANQVGYDLRISLIHLHKSKNRPDAPEIPEKILINPVFINLPPASDYMWEGCLSVAKGGLFCKVDRHKRVKIKYTTPDGAVVVEELKGLEAHIAQHELDHLEGRIFLDKNLDKSTFMSADEYQKMRKQEAKSKSK